MQGSFMYLSLFFLKPRSWIHHFNRNWNKCTKDHCKQNIQSFSPLGAESKPPSSSIVHFDVPSLVAICLLMHVLTNFIIVQLINTFNTKFILTNIQNWNINTRNLPLYKQNSSSDYYAHNLIAVTFLSKCYLSFTPLLRHHHKNLLTSNNKYFTDKTNKLLSHYHYLTFVLSLFTRQLSINDWNVRRFRQRWCYWLTSLLIGQYDRPWCWLVALVSPVRSSVLRLCHWTELADFESRKNEVDGKNNQIN